MNSSRGARAGSLVDPHHPDKGRRLGGRSASRGIGPGGWLAAIALAITALFASYPAPAQWSATPPFVEAAPRAGREAPFVEVAPRAAREAPFRGRLLHLSDGDSFVIRTEDGRRVPVRLSAIDAPEKNQAHGDVSRRALHALLDDVELTIIPIKRDPYGRTVARVLAGDTDVGLEQVRTGMAWHYKRYESEQTPRDRREHALAEQQARAASIGLWAAPDPVPPWRFRDSQRRKQGRANWPVPISVSSAMVGLAADLEWLFRFSRAAALSAA